MNSQFDLVKSILKDPKTNWVRINYAGHAKDAISAWFRSETGETVNHVKKSAIFASRMTSSRSTSLLLTMARDTGSRNEDGEFDYRSLMLADLDPSTLKPRINIPEILVAENFGTYQPIDLAGLPVFPGLTEELEPSFAVNLVELRSLEILKDKMTSKMSGLKKLLDKKGVLDQDGKRISWKNPEGTSETILDSVGNEVKKTPTVSFGFQLHPTEVPEVSFDAKVYSLKNIIQLWNEIEKVGEKIKDKMTLLRPFELGVMERLTDTESPFMVGGVEFSVKKLKSADYDWTPEDKAKVKSGEYKIGSVPKSKGRWICESVSK